MKKVWMGIGISNTYVDVLKRFPELIKNKGYTSLILILADKLDFDYNKRKRIQMVNDLFNQASKLNIASLKINVKRWNFLSKNKEYMQFFNKLKEMYHLDNTFKKRVHEIVKKNRQYLENNDYELMSNYVLAELASINYFSSKGFIKIGPRNQEEIFDKLSKDFPLTKKIKIEYI